MSLEHRWCNMQCKGASLNVFGIVSIRFTCIARKIQNRGRRPLYIAVWLILMNCRMGVIIKNVKKLTEVLISQRKINYMISHKI